MPPTWEDLAWSPLENLQKRQKNCYIPICTRQPWNCGLQYAVNLDLKVSKLLNRIWILCTLKYSLKMLFHASYNHCLFRSVALLHTGTRIKPKPIINKVSLINKTSSNKDYNIQGTIKIIKNSPIKISFEKVSSWKINNSKATYRIKFFTLSFCNC